MSQPPVFGAGPDPLGPGPAGPGEPAPMGPSGLGPLGDIQVMAAMLRRDGDDIGSYVRVLSETLSSALPAGLLDVDYDRSLSDRLAGRPGRPVRLVVHGGEGDLELGESRGRVVAEVRRAVNGVVISRKQVGIDEWVVLLARELSTLAARDSRAQAALSALFAGGF